MLKRESVQLLIVGGFIAAALAVGVGKTAAAESNLDADQVIGEPEVVKLFNGPMPTGVTVSRKGRIFVNFPRWGDAVPNTVIEVVDGKEVPFPSAEFQSVPPGGDQANGLVSVQSVVVDPTDTLWILDTGAPKFGPTKLGGPKLVGIDLATNKIKKKIVFPQTVALRTSYLNDVRFDMRRGKAGMAYITDSTGSGANGIIVADLATGKSWRKLHNHPSTRAEKGFLPVVEGKAIMVKGASAPATHINIGSDGIAISADGKQLYYCPLASRRLYRVSVDALSAPNMPDAKVAATVADLGDKGGLADGLESDAANNIYVTSPEHNAILRRRASGQWETIVHDPRILWPDTLSLANGKLYFIANQLHRGAMFNNGVDKRKKPYALMQVHIGQKPISVQHAGD